MSKKQVGACTCCVGTCLVTQKQLPYAPLLSILPNILVKYSSTGGPGTVDSGATGRACLPSGASYATTSINGMPANAIIPTSGDGTLTWAPPLFVIFARTSCQRPIADVVATLTATTGETYVMPPTGADGISAKRIIFNPVTTVAVTGGDGDYLSQAAFSAGSPYYDPDAPTITPTTALVKFVTYKRDSFAVSGAIGVGYRVSLSTSSGTFPAVYTPVYSDTTVADPDHPGFGKALIRYPTTETRPGFALTAETSPGVETFIASVNIALGCSYSV